MREPLDGSFVEVDQLRLRSVTGAQFERARVIVDRERLKDLSEAKAG